MLEDVPFLRVKMYNFLNSLKRRGHSSHILVCVMTPDSGMLSILVVKVLMRGNGLKFNLDKLGLDICCVFLDIRFIKHSKSLTGMVKDLDSLKYGHKYF